MEWIKNRKYVTKGNQNYPMSGDETSINNHKIWLALQMELI